MEEGKETDGGQVPGSMAPEPTSKKENNGDLSMKHDPLPVNSRLAFNHPERRLNNQMFRRIPCADVSEDGLLSAGGSIVEVMMEISDALSLLLMGNSLGYYRKFSRGYTWHITASGLHPGSWSAMSGVNSCSQSSADHIEIQILLKPATSARVANGCITRGISAIQVRNQMAEPAFRRMASAFDMEY